MDNRGGPRSGCAACAQRQPAGAGCGQGGAPLRRALAGQPAVAAGHAQVGGTGAAAGGAGTGMQASASREVIAGGTAAATTCMHACMVFTRCPLFACPGPGPACKFPPLLLLTGLTLLHAGTNPAACPPPPPPPCSFYQPWLTEALRGIFFAPHVLKVADAILAGLRGQLAEQRVANFSAVHLRIEGDWVLDPSQDLLAPYLSEMRLAGFTNSTPCYFASAVFDYKAERSECGGGGAGERGCRLHLRHRRHTHWRPLSDACWPRGALRPCPWGCSEAEARLSQAPGLLLTRAACRTRARRWPCCRGGGAEEALLGGRAVRAHLLQAHAGAGGVL